MKVIIQKKKILKSDVNELSSKLKLRWVQSSHAKNKTWEIQNSSDLRNNTSYIEQWFLFFNPITQTSIYDHDIINIITKKNMHKKWKGKSKKTPRLTCVHFLRTISNTFIYTCERIFFSIFWISTVRVPVFRNCCASKDQILLIFGDQLVHLLMSLRYLEGYFQSWKIHIPRW